MKTEYTRIYRASTPGLIQQAHIQQAGHDLIRHPVTGESIKTAVVDVYGYDSDGKILEAICGILPDTARFVATCMTGNFGG